MVLPLLIAVAAGYASLSAIRTAASVTFGVVVTKSIFDKWSLERKQRLGINPLRDDENASEWVVLNLAQVKNQLPHKFRFLANEGELTLLKRECAELEEAIERELDGKDTAFDPTWLVRVAKERSEDWLMRNSEQKEG